MAVNTTIILFLRIDLQDDGGEPSSIRYHTGTGTYYAKNSEWSDYKGAGGWIGFSPVTDGSTTAANEFAVELNIADTQKQRTQLVNLFDRIRAADLENREVMLHAAEIDNIKDTANLPEPRLVLLGRVANIEINAESIKMVIYTAATLLNQVVGGPSRYTDLTQNRFVDPQDKCLRFLDSATMQNVVFP